MNPLMSTTHLGRPKQIDMKYIFKKEKGREMGEGKRRHEWSSANAHVNHVRCLGEREGGWGNRRRDERREILKNIISKPLI